MVVDPSGGPLGAPSSASVRVLNDPAIRRLRLVCFSYAGAGGYVFRRWIDKLPGDVQICAIQLPGREDRVRERLPTDIDLLVNQLVDELSGYLDGPYAAFGHSLGAIIGTEVVRRLAAEGAIPPSHLFVSGSRPLPDIHDGRRRLHLLGDDELIEHLRTLNGTPAEVLDDERMRKYVLRLVRSDYTMLDTYQHRPGADLACPVTVLAGDNDPHTQGHDLQHWSTISSGPTEVIILPGDHFFVHSAEKQLLRLVSQRLTVGFRMAV